MIIDSLDGIIKSATVKGMMNRLYAGVTENASTNANVTSGGLTYQRYPQTMAIPTMGAGITGAWPTSFQTCSNGGSAICALEYVLGTLTLSTNAFVAGVSMPTKTMRLNGASSSVLTASQRALLHVNPTTDLVATTPSITITYTNQKGDTGRTATLKLPSDAVYTSAFSVTPHLQSGDTGIRAVTGMSTDTGSAGVLKLVGLLDIDSTNGFSGFGQMPINSLLLTKPLWLMEAGETLAFYKTTNGNGILLAAISAVAEY